MALLILDTLTEARDAKSFAIKDTTGAYNGVTNPTGYGLTGNVTTTINSILGAWLRITIPKAVTFYATATLSATAAKNNANNTADYVVTKAILGGLITDLLDIGVYKVLYIPFFIGNNGGYLLSGTSGTNIINGDVSQIDTASHIQIGGTGTIYTIATNDGVSVITTVETIDTTFSNTNIHICNLGFANTNYIAIKEQINNCIAIKTANLNIQSTCSCGCVTQTCASSLLATNLALYYGVDLNMQLIKYDDVQKILDYLNNYCNNLCGCGCN